MVYKRSRMFLRRGIVLIITWLGSEITRAQQNFLQVEFCPKNKTDWDTRRSNKNCADPPDYHCAAIESKQGQFGEICSYSALTWQGYCPVLNAVSHNLDYTDCTSEKECPQKAYRSNETYRYPFCFSIFSRNRSDEVPDNEKLDVTLVGVICAIGVTALIVLVIIMFVILKRKKKSKKKRHTETVANNRKKEDRSRELQEIELLNLQNQKQKTNGVQEEKQTLVPGISSSFHSPLI